MIGKGVADGAVSWGGGTTLAAAGGAAGSGAGSASLGRSFRFLGWTSTAVVGSSTLASSVLGLVTAAGGSAGVFSVGSGEAIQVEGSES